MSEWIKCSDKLPEDCGRVLVFNSEIAKYDARDGVNSPGVKVGRLLEYTRKLRPDGCMGYDDSTTHWMPLPDPPKEKE